MHALRLLLFVPLMAGAQPQRWVVGPASSLTIYGHTNMNRFECQTAYSGRDTLTMRADGKATRVTAGAVNLAVARFRCGNPIMTSDFRRTLHVAKYPCMRIRLIRFAGSLPAQEAIIPTDLEVTIAGVSRRYTMPCRLVRTSTHDLQVHGRGQFRFQEFGLTPPERLLGAVRVADELTVAFQLVLAEVR